MICNCRFPIHSIVLAAASKYFSASLASNFQEGKTKEFVLEGTDGETVEAIVDYSYTGQINLTNENVGKFLAIASSVDLDLLETECRQFLADKICENMCVDAFMAADKYDADIRKKAFQLICDNFEKLSSSDIQKLDHRLLGEILESDQLITDEGLLFTRLLEWVQSKEFIAESS